MKHQLSILMTISILGMTTAMADTPQITINNNNNSSPPSNSQQQNNCGNQANNNQSDNLRPGTYYKSNPNGGMDTVYTTGDKTPYIVDNSNNCNNAPLVQPYIYGIPDNRPNPGPRGR